MAEPTTEGGLPAKEVTFTREQLRALLDLGDQWYSSTFRIRAPLPSTKIGEIEVSIWTMQNRWERWRVQPNGHIKDLSSP